METSEINLDWSKRNGMKKTAAVISLLLFLAASAASANSRVYTNKDLQRYENRPANPVADFKANLKSSRISVDFMDAEVYQVLRMIAEEAKKKDGVEIFVSPEMSGRTTVKMTNVPWTEVLKEIEQKHNLGETFLGKRTILIYQKK
jgi:type II secretory pathway component HofQ